ncbi:hypothetical protein C8D90_101664 [Enterobacillus tribolii]|uniref:Uncharacterized protein n=1 Tax=Enterobacillus tribolii TaxID=1487935 RepID=A0A370R470_9GAMM|nr:hypothetical protein C8D90_101664 [Enterobacillus tribolii]
MKQASMNDVARVTGGASSSCSVIGYSRTSNGSCTQLFQCRDKHGKVSGNYNSAVSDSYCKGK